MKKDRLLMIFLSFVVGLSLTACSTKSSQSSGETSQKNMESTENAENTESTEKIENTGNAENIENAGNAGHTQKRDELKKRLELFKAFLLGEITVETEEDGPFYLSELYGLVFPEKYPVQYALYDMTGDGVPELHVLGEGYEVLTVKDDQLITWAEHDHYGRPLNNGAIYGTSASSSIFSYDFRNHKGERVFNCAFTVVYKNEFYFGVCADEYNGDIKLPKKDRKKLAKPFLSIGSDQIQWEEIKAKDCSEKDISNLEDYFQAYSQNMEESLSQDSENTEDIQETETLEERLKQYKVFLQDETDSEAEYALFDMTGDGLPELHVLADGYSIYSIEGGQLVTWYEGDQYERPLNNGTVLRTVDDGADTEYEYIVLNDMGEKVVSFVFTEGAADRYLICTGDKSKRSDYVALSKKQWDKLTKPLLAVGSDQIDWKAIDDLDF